MEVSQLCNLCNKSNDQMLMLSCIHDPCINCAATTFAEQVHIKGQSMETYICQICGQETILDQSTIEQLTTLANALVKSPTKSINFENKSIGNATINIAKTQPITNIKKVIYYCKDHAQQEITYYCFTCWNNICPQCAIHGEHKDHEVKLIKKAISQVKGQYMEVMGRINDSQNGMTKKKDGDLRLIKQCNQRHLRQKNQISRQFELIRNNLLTRQKQILKELDQINKHSVSGLTNLLEIINNTYENSNKIKKNIQGILKKDQVLILQEYRSIGNLTTKINQLNKNIDQLVGEIVHLNTEMLQNQIKQVIEQIGKIDISIKKEKIGLVKLDNISNGNIN